MKSEVEKELKKKNKIFDFKGLFKNFVAGAPQDVSEEEVILNDADLTKEQKELLIDCLKKEESYAKQIDIDAVVHFEARKGVASVKNEIGSNFISKKDNSKKEKSNDDDLVK